ncbi:hypothetical protein SAMN05216436_11121 [bacterium A37T11]|nr:hypothetical protein SAMN05216436_11121 [bacterium A37T11]
MQKRIILQVIIMLALASCGVNKQAKQLKAFESCHYELHAADSLFVAGTDVSSLISSRGKDLGSLPGIALGFLSREVPLTGLLRVNISNPGKELAGVNQFQYKILLQDKEVATGFSDQRIEVPPGKTVTVPVRIKANIYKLLQDRSTVNEIMDFIAGAKGNGPEKKTKVALKIKPTLALGNQTINYPGYITVEREISSSKIR